MISHGAAEALRDRLCVSSDAYKAVVCEECGDVAITNILEGTNTCRRCGNRAQFGTTTVPHGTQLLIYTLKGMGYNLIRRMKRVGQ